MSLTLPRQFSSLSSFTKREAIITRVFLSSMVGDDYQPLKPIIARVIKVTGEDPDLVITHRRKLTNKFDLMESRRKVKGDDIAEDQGVWLSRLTDRAEAFLEWLDEEAGEEGATWGTEDHPSVTKTTLGADSGWSLGELGFIVEEKLPFDLWRQINKEVKAKGYRTVIVPPEGKVYLGVVKEGKNKAVAIPTWEELNGPKEAVETVEEKRARLEAELAALGGN